jgi:hypothetical protein
MLRFDLLLLQAALVGLACLVALTAGAQAQPLSSEEVRLRILDDCVYSEWRRPEGRDTAATRCRCAARRLVAGLTAEEVTAFARRNQLPRSAQPKWNAAIEACSS